MALYAGTAGVALVEWTPRDTLRWSESAKVSSSSKGGPTSLGVTKVPQLTSRWRPTSAGGRVRVEQGGTGVAVRASLAEAVPTEAPAPAQARPAMTESVTWLVSITVVRKTWGNPLSPVLEYLEDSLLRRHVELELISEEVDPGTAAMHVHRFRELTCIA